MKLVSISGILVCILSAGGIGFAAPNVNFTISSDFDEPFDEHIQWCLDYKITSEVIPFDLWCPKFSQLADFSHRVGHLFGPNDLVPHTLICVNIPKTDPESTSYSLNEIESFIDYSEEDVTRWLTQFNEILIESYNPSPPPAIRFRLFNEVNSYKIFVPEDYYVLLEWFYPRLLKHMPAGSSLVISLSGAEDEGTDRDYKMYLRKMLLKHLDEHQPLDPLPFDGIDIHAGTTQYNSWSMVYQNIRAIFQEVFGIEAGNAQFNNLKFWSLETTRFPRGLCSTVFSRDIFEYGNDWDSARYVIKTITHVLNIPNMLFTTMILKTRPECGKRSMDGLFSLGGIYDHGCHTFDKGTRTPSYGVDSLKLFTNLLWQYYPDTSINHVFSIENIRRYQFKTPDNKYRLVVWRDYGNAEAVPAIIHVPFISKRVYVVDLINQTYEQIPVNAQGTGLQYIEIDLDSNPKLITPTLNIEPVQSRLVLPDIRSGVTDVASFDSGIWQSTIHLYNPETAEQFVEIHAFHANGTPVGSPYEASIVSRGSLHLDLGSIFSPFEGCVTVSATGVVIGHLEHILDSANGRRGVMSRFIPIYDESIDPAVVSYLTTDWEVSPAMKNLLTLINATESDSAATITIFDEAGSEMENVDLDLAPKERFVSPIMPESTAYRYGAVEVETEPGVTGQITRYAPSQSLWEENPLQTELKMVTELELKAYAITDAQAYSRIIVTNPWPEPVTGVILEKDVDNVLIDETPVSLNGNGTMELVLSSEAVSTVTFKLDDEVRVFGRREDVIMDTVNQTVTAVSSKSTSPDLARAGTLVLPYFVFENTAGLQKSTGIRVQNDNDFPVMIMVRLFDSSGELMTETERSISSRKTDTLSSMELMPSGTESIVGSVEIDVSRAGGIHAEADYIIQVPDQTTPFALNTVFEQMY